MPRLKTIVMVPKGAEFQAVQRGLRSHLDHQATKLVTVISLPVGPTPVKAALEQWRQTLAETKSSEEIHVVVMGLCGSLSPGIKLGEAVIYQRCLDGQPSPGKLDYVCSTDVPLTSTNPIISSVTPVTGITCDRVLSSAQDKQNLANQTGAEVVDMEGLAVIQALENQAQKISILRVVSDDSGHDLPDLSHAFDASGNVRPWVMAREFIQKPRAAIRLIQGSIKGLGILNKLAQDLARGIKENQTSAE